jgi:vitamin B12 transporter
MDSLKAPGEKEGYFIKEKQRDITGIFAEHQVKWGRLSLNGGLMVQWSPAYQWQYFPGIDVRFEANQQTSFFANINRATRLPSFTELYYTTSTHRSDPSLQPENALSAELGSKVKAERLQASATVFAISGNNLIDWVQDPENPVMGSSGNTLWTSMNITSSVTRGAELSFGYYPKQLEGRLNILHFSTGYTFIDKDTDSKGFNSAYSLDFLRHKLNASTGLSFGPVKFELLASWQDRNDYFDNLSRSEILFGPYWTMDGKISFQREGLLIYVDANNLFDQEFADFTGIILPGRWFKFGISQKIAY